MHIYVRARELIYGQNEIFRLLYIFIGVRPLGYRGDDFAAIYVIFFLLLIGFEFEKLF